MRLATALAVAFVAAGFSLPDSGDPTTAGADVGSTSTLEMDPALYVDTSLVGDGETRSRHLTTIPDRSNARPRH